MTHNDLSLLLSMYQHNWPDAMVHTAAQCALAVEFAQQDLSTAPLNLGKSCSA
ncbi:hypothetical protein [Shewanella sp. 125m-1]